MISWLLAMTEAGDLVHNPKRVKGCNQGTYNRILGSVLGHVPIQNVFFLQRSEVFQRKANYWGSLRFPGEMWVGTGGMLSQWLLPSILWSKECHQGAPGLPGLGPLLWDMSWHSIPCACHPSTQEGSLVWAVWQDPDWESAVLRAGALLCI